MSELKNRLFQITISLADKEEINSENSTVLNLVHNIASTYENQLNNEVSDRFMNKGGNQ